MRRGLTAVICVLLALSLIAGCSPESGADIDVAVLAKQIAEQVTFDEPLTELDTQAAERAFHVEADDVAAVGAWVGSGATVDEVSVWEANNDDDAADIAEALLTRVDTRIQDYADYKPEEVPKLEDAILLRAGKYVVLCVSPDAENARSIIDAAFKA